MMKFLLLALLLLIPELSFAQSTVATMFNPPPTDLSVGYLADIFGVVDGVLHGTGSQIMGTIFGVFNSAVLTLGSIIIMYILIVSTLNTAHEGEIMGKSWSSIWIPIRSITGFALVLPKATGYCFIQIFVMWVVVQGIGAADTVWDAALGYLARGGTLIQASPSSSSLNLPPLINPLSGNIFKSEVCMYGIQNSLTNTNSGTNVQVPDFATTISPIGVTTHLSPPAPCQAGACSNTGTCNKGFDCSQCDCSAAISFPGPSYLTSNGQNVSGNLQGICGNVTWNLSTDGGGGLSGGSTQAANPTNSALSDSRSAATQQVVLDLEPIADTVANSIIPVGNSSAPPSPIAAGNNNQALGFAASDYMGIMMPYLATLAQGANNQAVQLLNTSSATGWILAGSYYFQLAMLNREYSAQEGNPPVANFTANFANCKQNPSQPICTNATDAQLLANNLSAGTANCNGSSSTSGNQIDNFICWNTANLPAAGPGNTNPSLPGSANINGLPSWASAIINILTGPLGDIMQSLHDFGSSGVDPIMEISNLGISLVNAAELVWVGGTVALFGASMVMSIGLCANPAGMALVTALVWFVPVVMTICLALFVSGAMMAFYVPLIPFIIFLFTTIGWFVAVIESMVAAPLVAIGIAVPEGHQVFGQAQQAIMLLTNVFIRPAMIIIGFIAGSILSHVALWLLNQGIVQVMPYEQVDLLVIASIIAILVIYVGIILSIVNRSFALIYEVPNRVLRWIGGGVEQFGEEGGFKEVQSTAQEGMGVAKAGAQQAYQGASEAGGNIGKSLAKTPKGPTDAKVTSNAGAGTGGNIPKGGSAPKGGGGGGGPGAKVGP